MTPEEQATEQAFWSEISKERDLRLMGRVASRSMAKQAGHTLSGEREKRPVVGQEYQLDMRRWICSCGWASHWANGQAAIRLRDEHLRWAAVNG
jgi:hypothetical protein